VANERVGGPHCPDFVQASEQTLTTQDPCEPFDPQGACVLGAAALSQRGPGIAGERRSYLWAFPAMPILARCAASSAGVLGPWGGPEQRGAFARSPSGILVPSGVAGTSGPCLPTVLARERRGRRRGKRLWVQAV
jgi:hypothetical protein